MSGFEDVVFGWKGQEFRVAPDRCMKLLAMIEEVLAPDGGAQNLFQKLSNPITIHMTVIARVYAMALRYAGCEVSDEEVFLSLSKGITKGGMEGYADILTLSQGLLSMFFPDWAIDEDLAAGEEGKADGVTDDIPSSAESSDPSMKPLSAVDTPAQ